MDGCGFAAAGHHRSIASDKIGGFIFAEQKLSKKMNCFIFHRGENSLVSPEQAKPESSFFVGQLHL